MAFARYGYSVGATTSPAVGSLLSGPLVAKLLDGAAAAGPFVNLGWEEFRSVPAAPPGNPATGDEVSKPPNCAEVYICGGTFEEMDVSGRPFV